MTSIEKDQRVAIVTGANRGLGKGTAAALAERGWRVVLAGRRPEPLASTLEDLQKRYPTAQLEAGTVDIGKDDSVAAFFEQLELPRLDSLINCAGVILEAAGGGVLELEPATLLDTLEVNALGAHRMSRHVLPTLNAAGRGTIVNVSSGMGALTDMGSGTAGYRISKAALNAITIQYARAANEGVKVNAVCPGWVRTDMGTAQATRSIPEGVASILWAVELDASGPSGGFFRDGQAIAW